MTTTEERPAEWRPVDDFAARLALLRHDMDGISVEKIARLCGLAPSTWLTWEAGVIPQKYPTVIAKIVAATGVDQDWLMRGGDLRKPSLTWTSHLRRAEQERHPSTSPRRFAEQVA